MKLKIIPYKMTSESAKLLQKHLSEKVGYYVYRGKEVPDHKLIKWGRTPNKIYNFQLMEKAGVPHVPYTTSKAVAEGWLKEGATVFARSPGGEQGLGIEIVTKNDGPLPEKPLYTKYVKHFTEFRVNVAYDKAIHHSQKRKVREDANPLIRSHSGGWGFRIPLFIPDGINEVAVAAAKAVGLELAGVDIIYNKFYNKFYVLEVNSAPWLNDNIADKYATEIVTKNT